MTSAAEDLDGPLVLSTAAIWRCYLDEQSALLDAAIRPSQLYPSFSRLAEAFGDAVAASIAEAFSHVAGGWIARLYESSRLEAGSDDENH